MTPALAQRRLSVFAAAVLLAVACGGLVARMPAMAAVLGAAIVTTAGLIVLGERAFAWAIVLAAVAPWYPLTSGAAVAPSLPQPVFCAILAAAPIVPWLWDRAGKRWGRNPSRLGLLYGLAFPLLAVSIYQTVGAVKPLIASSTFAILFGGATFFAGRRFAGTGAWGAAAFTGSCVLVLLGTAALVAAPGSRVGDFAGYPITYGGLLVGLLPSAVLWAGRRSRALAVLLVTAVCGMMILSQSRSSWIATVVLLVVLSALLVRQRRWRELGGIAALTAIAAGLILATGSLNGIVERKLSADQLKTDSVTHRAFGYGFAADQIKERPVFGGGAPGYSQEQVEDETGIGALDNGYLSITVDTGLLGLFTVIVPILIALGLLGRWLGSGVEPAPDDLVLVLGIIGLAVVTVFYDTFYWAQLSLLIFAMGGALSARWSLRPAPRVTRQRRRPARQRLAVPSLSP